MTDETTSAAAVGRAVSEAQSPAQRAKAVVDCWYADHFHAAAIDGRTPITAEEKASLIAHVTEALTPKE